VVGTPLRPMIGSWRPVTVAIATLLFVVAAPVSASSGTFTGVLELDLDLKVNPATAPDGTALSASVTASVSNASNDNVSSAEGTLTASDGEAKGTVMLYYTWQADPGAEVSVSIGVQGYSTGANGAYQDTAFFKRQITLPANGATTVLVFDNTL
jgi:hypothetical protein